MPERFESKTTYLLSGETAGCLSSVSPPAAISSAYKDLTGGLSDLDKDNLAKTAAKMAVLVKTPERVRKVCEDIVEHFQTMGPFWLPIPAR